MTNQINKARECLEMAQDLIKSIKHSVYYVDTLDAADNCIDQALAVFDTLSTVDAGRLESALNRFSKFGPDTPVYDIRDIAEAARTLHGIIGEKIWKTILNWYAMQ